MLLMLEGLNLLTPKGITLVRMKEAMSDGMCEVTNAPISDSEGQVTVDGSEGPGTLPRAQSPLRTMDATQRSIVFEGKVDVRHLVLCLVYVIDLGLEESGEKIYMAPSIASEQAQPMSRSPHCLI
jgi:hypothetical protein